MRTETGKRAPQSLFIPAIISSTNLMRFSNDPPYLSVLKFMAGDRNSLIR